MEHPTAATLAPVRFETHPSRYIHWRLEIEPPLARLVMDVEEERAQRPGYPLKLNSYDLGVDIELADAVQRLRFEHPEVRAVVVVCHHPPYTNSGTHGPSEEVRRRFAGPAKECAKFRFFVAGHIHNYERFLIDGVPFVVSGGGGAPQTAVRTENYRTDPVYVGPSLRPFHYLMVAVGEKKATVDVMMLQSDETWKSGDRFELDY